MALQLEQLFMKPSNGGNVSELGNPSAAGHGIDDDTDFRRPTVRFTLQHI